MQPGNTEVEIRARIDTSMFLPQTPVPEFYMHPPSPPPTLLPLGLPDATQTFTGRASLCSSRAPFLSFPCDLLLVAHSAALAWNLGDVELSGWTDPTTDVCRSTHFLGESPPHNFFYLFLFTFPCTAVSTAYIPRSHRFGPANPGEVSKPDQRQHNAHEPLGWALHSHSYKAASRRALTPG